jgi:hypothetical protein
VDETALRQKVGQLLSEVHSIPLDPKNVVTGPGGSAPPGASSMRREMAALEDSLDHVRLAIKYLVFDLEATKRENRLLREMLGES